MLAKPVVQDTVSETLDVTHAVPVSPQAENVLLIWERASEVSEKEVRAAPAPAHHPRRTSFQTNQSSDCHRLA